MCGLLEGGEVDVVEAGTPDDTPADTSADATAAEEGGDTTSCEASEG